MIVIEQVGKALLLAFAMLWEVLWPLALGFLLSAVVQTVVSRQAVAGAPIVNIHRKYYGGRMSLYLLGVSYVAMVLAGLAVELGFQALGLVPAHFQVAVLESRPQWNWTTYLNLAFLLLAAVLGWRFLTTGGREMLRMMSAPST